MAAIAVPARRVILRILFTSGIISSVPANSPVRPNVSTILPLASAGASG
jgi:hypothetical protein